MVAWKTEHGVEFNVLLNYGPFLVRPVVQYYTNVDGIGGHAVVAGFRTRVDFERKIEFRGTVEWDPCGTMDEVSFVSLSSDMGQKPKSVTAAPWSALTLRADIAAPVL
jgi:hypothetical protein